MSSQKPDFACHHNTPESHENLKHDRDLPASSCSRFVTRYHVMSDRHGTLRAPSDRITQRARVNGAQAEEVPSPVAGGVHPDSSAIRLRT